MRNRFRKRQLGYAKSKRAELKAEGAGRQANGIGRLNSGWSAKWGPRDQLRTQRSCNPGRCPRARLQYDSCGSVGTGWGTARKWIWGLLPLLKGCTYLERRPCDVVERVSSGCSCGTQAFARPVVTRRRFLLRLRAGAALFPRRGRPRRATLPRSLVLELPGYSFRWSKGGHSTNQPS